MKRYTDCINFNPRSHKGSDREAVKAVRESAISIHAPTRGATAEIFGYGGIFYISIHAPTRGATICHVGKICTTTISIHAPTRGATQITHKQSICQEISIHAPTRGATNTKNVLTNLFLFQSTLPQGERPFKRGDINAKNNFNPRSHKGSDFDFSDFCNCSR